MPVVSVGQLTITDVNDGLNLVLSNESHNIPTDAAGNSPVFTGAVSSAKVLAGGTDVTSSWTITVVTSVGLSGSFSNNTYTVTGLTTDTGTVEFKANRPGYSELSAIFTLTKSKKGDQGNPGLDGLTIVVSNESHTLPANSSGTVSSYANSGTTIRVYEGSVELNAVSGASSNGSFGIGTPSQLPASTITVGAISYSGKIATVAAHSAMASGTDSVVITFPITIRRANGGVVTSSKTQTLTKSKQGAAGTPGTPGTAGPRGTVHLFKLIAGSIWSNAEASDLFAVGQIYNPVMIADRVTLYNDIAGFSQTRAWTGTAWEIQNDVVDGSLLVTQSITADKININDLYARDATITGQLTVGDDTNFVRLGGSNLMIAKQDTRTLFAVNSSGTGFLMGESIGPHSIQPNAFSAAALDYLRSELGASTPTAGGTVSSGFAMVSGTYALGALNSGGSAVTLNINYVGDSQLVNSGSLPLRPSITLTIRRNGVQILTQTFMGQVYGGEVLNGTWVYEVATPTINWSPVDSTPGSGSVTYSVVVTVNSYPHRTGGFNFAATQTATGWGSGGSATWENISGKPDTATRWPAFSEVTGTAAAVQIPNLDAGKITTGVLAAARIPSLDAGKVTTGTFAAARIPTGISITGNAGTVTNGVYTNGSYANPSWLTGLDAGKLTSGTLPDARLSGTYSGFTHKIDGSNTVFTTPSSGTASALARTVYGLAEFRSNASSAVGAIVFKSPTNSTAIMMQLEIAVMLYSSARISHITVQGYRSTATAYANLRKISKGTFVVQVRFATEVGTGKTCIVLGNESSTWSYPHLSVIRAMFSHVNVTDTFCTGWTTAIETTLAGYENFTADIPDTAMVGSITGNASTATTLNYQAKSNQNLDTAATAGRLEYFEGSSVTGAPNTNWHSFISVRHNNSANLHGFQLAYQFRTDNFSVRGATGSAYRSWLTLLHSGNFNAYSPTLTGTGASGTWGISVTGNAGTATTLQTARTINGTSFNGSANITTANWGTARNITIGDTTKSVNGGGNVTWSYNEINAASIGSTGYGETRLTWVQNSTGFAGYSSGWASYLINNHGNGQTYYNQTIIMPFGSAPQYSRLENGVLKGPYTFITSENLQPDTPPPAGLEGVITASWLSAGVVTANIIASGGINVVDGGNKVSIHPKSNTPILFEKDGETTFSVNIDGTGFFKGSLAKDTVSAEALQDEAKKAINPRYLGGGERQVLNGGLASTLNTTTSTTAAGQLNTFTTLSQNDRVVLSARLQDSRYWFEFFDGTSEPAWVSSTFIVRFERSVNNGAWTTVGSQITLNVPVYSSGGFQAHGEPYEPREKGYFYDRSLSFTDTVPSTSSNVMYRLYIQRTSPTGTVGGGAGPAAGLRVITFTGERSAFNLNEIRGSTVKQWIDKDTGFSIVTGTVTRIGIGSDLVNFPTPFAEVYSCALGFNRQNETAGTYRYASRYRSLTTSSVTIDTMDGHTGSPNVTSYQVIGRVAV